MPCLDEWFPPATDLASISVTDLSDGSTFHRQVPAVYLFHLHWIIHESSTPGEPGPEEGVRPAWLREVLDRFSEEVRAMGDVSDWRSIVLNPVLVRAMHRADDLDERSITRKAKIDARITGRKMTLKEWEGFYLNLDVVQPIHKGWWLKAKPIGPECPTDVPVMEGMGSARGVVLFTRCPSRLTSLIIVEQALSQSVLAPSSGCDSPLPTHHQAHLEDRIGTPSTPPTGLEGHLTSNCGIDAIQCAEIHGGIPQSLGQPTALDRDEDPTVEQELIASPADLNLSPSADINGLWLGDTAMDIHWHDGHCELSHNGTLTPPLEGQAPSGWYSLELVTG